MSSFDFRPETIEKQRASVIKFLYWFIIAACVFMFGKYLLPPLTPFIIAYFIAAILNRPITFLTSKIRLPRGVVSAVLVISFAFISGGLITLLGIWAANSIKSIIVVVPDIMQDGVFPFLHEFLAGIESFISNFDPVGGKDLENIMNAVFSGLNEGTVALTSNVLSFLGSLIAKVPSLFFKTIITIIAGIFIATDFDAIKEFLYQCTPKAWKLVVGEGKEFFSKNVLKCGVAYIFIFMVTFTELWAGLGIIKVHHVTIIAFIISILDILPVLGTGTILIPWSVISFCMGNFARGIYIFALYIAMTAVRNMIEPKLVGKQIKLHPLLTLSSMLIGARFFGIFGMLGLPLTIAFIKRLNDDGFINVPFLNFDISSAKKKSKKDEADGKKSKSKGN